MARLESTHSRMVLAFGEIWKNWENTVSHGVEFAAILGALDQEIRDPRLSMLKLMGDYR